MNFDRQAAMLINDLDNILMRIEDLPGHTRYTDALLLVQQARGAIGDGRSQLHQTALEERYASGAARRVAPVR